MELDVMGLGAPGLEEDPETAGNLVFARYRRVSLGLLCGAFSPGERVLDFGCGSGLEACYLALRGLRVIAVDPVPGRVEATRHRAETLGVSDLVEARVVGPGRLQVLAGELGEGSLDGAYSSFGPLNCEEGLGPAAEALGSMLRPGSAFVGSVMNRICAWEIASSMARLRPGEAFRRLRVLEAHTGGGDVTVRYYDLEELRDAFSPWFDLETARGLAKLPPPSCDGLARHFPGFLDWATGFDPGPLVGLGDHLFVVMRRR